jgi:hypothetical protein
MRKNPSIFLTNKIGKLAGDLDCQMNPFLRFLSMYFQGTDSSSYNKLQMGPNGGCVPSSKSIAQSYG